MDAPEEAARGTDAIRLDEGRIRSYLLRSSII